MSSPVVASMTVLPDTVLPVLHPNSIPILASVILFASTVAPEAFVRSMPELVLEPFSSMIRFDLTMSFPLTLIPVPPPPPWIAAIVLLTIVASIADWQRRTGRKWNEDLPPWVFEAGHFILSRELGLPYQPPRWLKQPAVMAVPISTPQVIALTLSALSRQTRQQLIFVSGVSFL